MFTNFQRKNMMSRTAGNHFSQWSEEVERLNGPAGPEHFGKDERYHGRYQQQGYGKHHQDAYQQPRDYSYQQNQRNYYPENRHDQFRQHSSQYRSHSPQDSRQTYHDNKENKNNPYHPDYYKASKDEIMRGHTWSSREQRRSYSPNRSHDNRSHESWSHDSRSRRREEHRRRRSPQRKHPNSPKSARAPRNYRSRVRSSRSPSGSRKRSRKKERRNRSKSSSSVASESSAGSGRGEMSPKKRKINGWDLTPERKHAPDNRRKTPISVRKVDKKLNFNSRTPYNRSRFTPYNRSRFTWKRQETKDETTVGDLTIPPITSDEFSQRSEEAESNADKEESDNSKLLDNIETEGKYKIGNDAESKGKEEVKSEKCVSEQITQNENTAATTEYEVKIDHKEERNASSGDMSSEYYEIRNVTENDASENEVQHILKRKASIEERKSTKIEKKSFETNNIIDDDKDDSDHDNTMEEINANNCCNEALNSLRKTESSKSAYHINHTNDREVYDNTDEMTKEKQPAFIPNKTITRRETLPSTPVINNNDKEVNKNTIEDGEEEKFEQKKKRTVEELKETLIKTKSIGNGMIDKIVSLVASKAKNSNETALSKNKTQDKDKKEVLTSEIATENNHDEKLTKNNKQDQNPKDGNIWRKKTKYDGKIEPSKSKNENDNSAEKIHSKTSVAKTEHEKISKENSKILENPVRKSDDGNLKEQTQNEKSVTCNKSEEVSIDKCSKKHSKQEIVKGWNPDVTKHEKGSHLRTQIRSDDVKPNLTKHRHHEGQFTSRCVIEKQFDRPASPEWKESPPPYTSQSSVQNKNYYFSGGPSMITAKEQEGKADLVNTAIVKGTVNRPTGDIFIPLVKPSEKKRRFTPTSPVPEFIGAAGTKPGHTPEIVKEKETNHLAEVENNMKGVGVNRCADNALLEEKTVTGHKQCLFGKSEKRISHFNTIDKNKVPKHQVQDLRTKLNNRSQLKNAAPKPAKHPFKRFPINRSSKSSPLKVQRKEVSLEKENTISKDVKRARSHIESSTETKFSESRVAMPAVDNTYSSKRPDEKKTYGDKSKTATKRSSEEKHSYKYTNEKKRKHDESIAENKMKKSGNAVSSEKSEKFKHMKVENKSQREVLEKNPKLHKSYSRESIEELKVKDDGTKKNLTNQNEQRVKHKEFHRESKKDEKVDKLHNLNKSLSSVSNSEKPKSEEINCLDVCKTFETENCTNVKELTGVKKDNDHSEITTNYFKKHNLKERMKSKSTCLRSDKQVDKEINSDKNLSKDYKRNISTNETKLLNDTTGNSVAHVDSEVKKDDVHLQGDEKNNADNRMTKLVGIKCLNSPIAPPNHSIAENEKQDPIDLKNDKHLSKENTITDTWKTKLVGVSYSKSDLKAEKAANEAIDTQSNKQREIHNTLTNEKTNNDLYSQNSFSALKTGKEIQSQNVPKNETTIREIQIQNTPKDDKTEREIGIQNTLKDEKSKKEQATLKCKRIDRKTETRNCAKDENSNKDTINQTVLHDDKTIKELNVQNVSNYDETNSGRHVEKFENHFNRKENDCDSKHSDSKSDYESDMDDIEPIEMIGSVFMNDITIDEPNESNLNNRIDVDSSETDFKVDYCDDTVLFQSKDPNDLSENTDEADKVIEPKTTKEDLSGAENDSKRRFISECLNSDNVNEINTEKVADRNRQTEKGYDELIEKNLESDKVIDSSPDRHKKNTPRKRFTAKLETLGKLIEDEKEIENEKILKDSEETKISTQYVKKKTYVESECSDCEDDAELFASGVSGVAISSGVELTGKGALGTSTTTTTEWLKKAKSNLKVPERLRKPETQIQPYHSDSDIDIIPDMPQSCKTFSKKVFDEGFVLTHKKWLLDGSCEITTAHLVPKRLYRTTSEGNGKNLGKCLQCHSCAMYFTPLTFTVHHDTNSIVEQIDVDRSKLQKYCLPPKVNSDAYKIFRDFNIYFDNERSKRYDASPVKLPRTTTPALDDGVYEDLPSAQAILKQDASQTIPEDVIPAKAMVSPSIYREGMPSNPLCVPNSNLFVTKTSSKPEEVIGQISSKQGNTTVQTSAKPENVTLQASSKQENAPVRAVSQQENITIQTSAKPENTTVQTLSRPENSTVESIRSTSRCEALSISSIESTQAGSKMATKDLNSESIKTVHDQSANRRTSRSPVGGQFAPVEKVKQKDPQLPRQLSGNVETQNQLVYTSSSYMYQQTKSSLSTAKMPSRENHDRHRVHASMVNSSPPSTQPLGIQHGHLTSAQQFQPGNRIQTAQVPQQNSMLQFQQQMVQTKKQQRRHSFVDQGMHQSQQVKPRGTKRTDRQVLQQGHKGMYYDMQANSLQQSPAYQQSVNYSYQKEQSHFDSDFPQKVPVLAHLGNVPMFSSLTAPLMNQNISASMNQAQVDARYQTKPPVNTSDFTGVSLAVTQSQGIPVVLSDCVQTSEQSASTSNVTTQNVNFAMALAQIEMPGVQEPVPPKKSTQSREMIEAAKEEKRIKLYRELCDLDNINTGDVGVDIILHAQKSVLRGMSLIDPEILRKLEERCDTILQQGQQQQQHLLTSQSGRERQSIEERAKYLAQLKRYPPP
ncbi:uncharacterized protein LOC123564338 isoform X2 [Mercenaria mercenaria]|uniref:uncharacterized protein LOC123564338 isoform X2 n=1 Tax=Mercenaria mercenaria TaxID=6596 RepID=UPI00234F08C9|nr:uncharacterized protein LOC123564338 isoform X2 [Mercenaria mercenaria]